MAQGGGPVRGVELGRIRWCNTQTGLRSLLIVGPLLGCVSHYNKTEAQSGQPRLVVRFYPESTARLLIAYLAEVRPLWLFLDGVMSGEVRPAHADSSLIWHTRGQPWTARQFSRALADSTEAHLGVRLPLSIWRHVVVAICRDHLRIRDTDHPEPSANLALQTGHTLRVEDHHYGLTVDMLTGVTSHTLLGFGQSSRRWHEFLAPPLRPLALKRRRVSDPDDGDGDDDREGRPARLDDLRGVERRLDALASVLHRLEAHLLADARPEAPGTSGRSRSRSRSSGSSSVGVLGGDDGLAVPAPSVVRSVTPTTRSTSTSSDLAAPRTESSVSPASSDLAAPRTESSVSPASSSASSASRSGGAAASALRWQRALKVAGQLYGSTSFTFRSPGQEKAVRACLDLQRGQDLLVCLPTGAGKTLLVELAAMVNHGKTVVVVVPYVVLQHNMLERLRRRGIAAVAYSSDLHGVHSVVVVVLEAMDEAFFLYANGLQAQGGLSHLFWDEAHLIVRDSDSEPGPDGQHRDFRVWREKLARTRSLALPRVFMSATLAPTDVEVLGQIAGIDFLHLDTVRESVNVPGLAWAVVKVPPASLIATLVARVRGALSSGRVLVYVASRVRGAEAAAALACAFYHGGLDPAERESIRRGFEAADGPRVLVATTAAGEGWDIQGVGTVLIFDRVFDPMTLVQQAGRCARGPGAQGRCLVLLSTETRSRVGPSSDVDRRALSDFLHGPRCRRAVIVGHFDGESRGFCRPEEEEALCDVCAPPSPAPPSSSPPCDVRAPPSPAPPSSSSPPVVPPGEGFVSARCLPRDPVAAAPSPTRADVADVLRRLWVRRQHERVRCDFCWLTGHDRAETHVMGRCTRELAVRTIHRDEFYTAEVDVDLDDRVKRLRAAFKKALPLERASSIGIHYSCLTPRRDFEQGFFDYREDCVYAGWFLRVLFVGLFHDRYRAHIAQQWQVDRRQPIDLQAEAVAFVRPLPAGETRPAQSVLVLWEIVWWVAAQFLDEPN
jgi:hypothetical protein